MFEVTIQDICTPGYSKKVRAVTAKIKRQAYAQYGITSWEPGDYEVDHLIPLSLGGSNSILNLWPQSCRTSPWNAHVKNVLERRLHDMICAGKVVLQTARHEIATDWIKAYQKLTRVIGGRTVQRATAEVGKLVIRFDDQSTMQVKTAGIADRFPPGGKIKAIQEDGCEFNLHFEDGSALNLRLVDPGSSVAVRDKNNRVEYLG